MRLILAHSWFPRRRKKFSGYFTLYASRRHIVWKKNISSPRHIEMKIWKQTDMKLSANFTTDKTISYWKKNLTLGSVYRGRRSHQGRDNWLLAEIHHTRIIVTNHYTDHVCLLELEIPLSIKIKAFNVLDGTETDCKLWFWYIDYKIERYFVHYTVNHENYRKFSEEPPVLGELAETERFLCSYDKELWFRSQTSALFFQVGNPALKCLM